MTKEQLAEMLHGRQYGDEITDAEEKYADDAGLVVVFGASDDCVEFRGAINDEGYTNDEDEVWFDRDGIKTIDEDEQEILQKHGVMAQVMAKAKQLTAEFGKKGSDYSWEISTEIPHATFDILEDDEKFCRGIVFSIADLPA